MNLRPMFTPKEPGLATEIRNIWSALRQAIFKGDNVQLGRIEATSLEVSGVEIAGKTQMSVTSDINGFKLVSDAVAPGNSKLYGTDGSGAKGWFAQPAGVTPGGSSGNVQYNDGSGGFGAEAAFSYDAANNILTVDRISALNLALAVTTKTGNYTLTASDYLVICNANETDITMTLPTAVGCNGRLYTFKRINSYSGKTIIDGSGTETIDGALTFTLSAQYKYLTIISDNANWHIIANN